ncbi:FtsZ-binding cell division protein ZapB [Hymenobacter sp. UYAg731]
MEFNSSKLERTSKLVYTLISLVLCGFLIALSEKIIGDLDPASQRPQLESFASKGRAALEDQLAVLQLEAETLQDKNEAIEQTIATARQNYDNEKQSFENWIKTRKTLGSPDKDQEVVDRARKLDEYYKIEQDWRSKLNVRKLQINARNKQKELIQKQLDKENQSAQIRFDAALRWHDLKIFLIRLLFVGPILGLGIFFFVRYRKHKFWPLYFGFSLFSLYAFFVGLVPYLPSYGGYIRYTVGIALSVGLGYYAIKRIRAYMEQKQEELKSSTQERARNVQLEVAEKALENHFCPSCGKDFIIKKWEAPAKTIGNEALQVVTDFCRHCGLNLFVDCHNCGHKNFAHLPFCASCGAKSAAKSAA